MANDQFSERSSESKAFISLLGIVAVVFLAYMLPMGGFIAAYILSKNGLENRPKVVRVLYWIAGIIFVVQVCIFVRFTFGWPGAEETFYESDETVVNELLNRN
ncbi:hypothetical protein [Haloglycomyces albus]|uniref:hypothetical protein n=1 Tax=Haloglycomyces albus TaxID=526067 RepID=UPI0012EC8453|nr:hypothetical protein [Haloglycomyces albus]